MADHEDADREQHATEYRKCRRKSPRYEQPLPDSGADWVLGNDSFERGRDDGSREPLREQVADRRARQAADRNRDRGLRGDGGRSARIQSREGDRGACPDRAHDPDLDERLPERQVPLAAVGRSTRHEPFADLLRAPRTELVGEDGARDSADDEHRDVAPHERRVVREAGRNWDQEGQQHRHRKAADQVGGSQPDLHPPDDTLPDLLPILRHA